VIDNLATGKALPLDLALNPVVINVEAFDVENIEDRASIDYHLKVYVNNGSDFELVATLEAKEEPVQLSGLVKRFNGAWFDISGILRGYLDPSFTLPLSGVVEQSGMTVQYYTAVEIYVDGVETDSFSNPSSWAYWGGLSKVNFDYIEGRFFSNYIGEDRKFLTYAPRKGKIYPHLVEYLSWLNHYTDISTEVSLNVWAYYQNGAVVKEQPLSVNRPAAMAVYTFALGVENLGIQTRDLLGIKVFLSNQSNFRVSEVMEYEFQREPKARVLVFQNSLGVPSTVVSNGLYYSKLNFKREVGEVFSGFTPSPSSADIRVEKAQGVREFSFRLGFFTEDYSYLGELGLALKTFILQDGKWLAVVPLFESIDTEDPEMWAKEFDLHYRFATEDENFTNVAAASIQNTLPTGWKPYRTACELDEFGKFTGKLKVLELVRYFLETGDHVKPLEVKKNVSGTEGFIDLTDSGSCLPENTPHFNDEYTVQGRFRRQTCAAGLVGDYPTIIIPAGRWGSILNKNDANKKAKNEATLLDTQAYANLNGPCNTVGVYDPGTIPVNRWWVRMGSFLGQSSLSGFSADLEGSGYRPGNMWYQEAHLQSNQTDVYISNRFDRHYPVLDSPRFYEFVCYHLNGKSVRFFCNGLLVETVPVSKDHVIMPFPSAPTSGDKWYIDFI
jgi:hypothetical protein